MIYLHSSLYYLVMCCLENNFVTNFYRNMTEKTLVLQEFESSTSIPITHRIYTQQLEKYPDYKEKYSIFYFKNGTRKSSNRIEYKKTNKRNNLINFTYYKDKVVMLPLIRKSADEIQTMVPQVLSEMQSLVYRTVVYCEEEAAYKLRIALEYRAAETAGVTYFITGEVEYDQSIAYYQEAVKPMERIMFAKLVELFGDIIITRTSEKLFVFPKPSYICNVPSRVFTMFNTGYASSKQEVKSYKWDGHKGRFYIQNGIMYFYDDLHNTVQTTCPALNAFENIFFQVEVMQKVFIITDVLGGYIGSEPVPKNLYMPEPLEVLRFFNFMRQTWSTAGIEEPIDIDMKHLGKFTFRTQFHLTKTSPKAKTLNLPFDGFIVTSASRIFKFKMPTIDARMINGVLHIDGAAASISSQQFKSTPDNEIKNNAIYEIAPNITNNDKTYNFTILKLRYDRSFTSTVSQFTNFMNEINFFREHSQ